MVKSGVKMNIWALLMIIAAGLFAGGSLAFAWSRVPIWRRMSVEQYVRDFAETLDLTDKVQPAFALIAVISAAVFAFNETGLRQILAIVGAVGLAIVVVLSFAVLVPLQRRIIAVGGDPSADVADMRARWDQGNLGRSVLSVLAFVAMAAAAVVAA